MTDISEIVLLPRAAQPPPTEQRRGVHIEAEKIAADSARRLEDGEVDLAVGFMPQLEAGFYQQVLFQQNFVCLVARGHPRIGARLWQGGICESEAHLAVRPRARATPSSTRPSRAAGVRRRTALQRFQLPGRGAHRGRHRADRDRAQPFRRA